MTHSWHNTSAILIVLGALATGGVAQAQSSSNSDADSASASNASSGDMTVDASDIGAPAPADENGVIGDSDNGVGTPSARQGNAPATATSTSSGTTAPGTAGPATAQPPSARLPEPERSDYGADNFQAPDDAQLDDFDRSHANAAMAAAGDNELNQPNPPASATTAPTSTPADSQAQLPTRTGPQGDTPSAGTPEPTAGTPAMQTTPASGDATAPSDLPAPDDYTGDTSQP